MANGITNTYEWGQRNVHISNSYVREAIAEFFGTMLLLFMVAGAGLQAAIHPDSHAVAVFGVVFGLMVAIMVFGGISGAHINPAVSIGLAVAGHLHWAKVPLYIFVQILGGYLGTLLAYGLYKDHLFYDIVVKESGRKDLSIPEFDMQLNGGVIMTSLSPSGGGNFLGVGIATEIVLTAILLMAVMAAIDKGNMKIPTFMVQFYLCLTVASLAFAHGVITGTLLNPARDFAPRLAAYTLGWDKKFAFQSVNFDGNLQEWWVVGIFGPPIGAVVGVFLYIFFVGSQLPNNRDDLEMEKVNARVQNENADWRNGTKFVPRNGPPPALQPLPQIPQPHPNYTANVNGHYNPGYLRDSNMGQQRQY